MNAEAGLLETFELEWNMRPFVIGPGEKASAGGRDGPGPDSAPWVTTLQRKRRYRDDLVARRPPALLSLHFELSSPK